ncbi:hypothetical protein [Asaia lannensis]
MNQNVLSLSDTAGITDPDETAPCHADPTNDGASATGGLPD